MGSIGVPAIWALGVCVMTLGQTEFVSSIDPTNVPAHKATTDAKYLSSQDVYQIVLAEPSVLFIDVRDPIEIAHQGHPAYIDAIVPVRIQQFETRAMPQNGQLASNPYFLTTMENVIAEQGQSKDDLIILACGSGRRSAEAAQILIDAGFTNVYHVPDGYDGDDAPGFNEQHAWKMAGLPWSNDLTATNPWSLEISE